MENTNPWVIQGSSKARLVSHTPEPEAIMGYIARVTSKDQSNPSVERLLNYCAKHGHWSVFEQASMTVEVVTPLAISVQLLRHRSFTFQQFSGRYEDQQFMKTHTEGLSALHDMFYVPEEARVQDPKNRQNSIFDGTGELTDAMWNTMSTAYTVALHCYQDLLQRGIAKELARFVLTQGVYSRLYVTGSCRSWIHYIGVRDDVGVAQWEHCEIAKAVKSVFSSTFPTVYSSLDWEYNKSSEEAQALRKQILELQSEIAVLKAKSE
jgi:thymidylate synthase (FAD)